MNAASEIKAIFYCPLCLQVGQQLPHKFNTRFFHYHATTRTINSFK